MQYNEHYQTFTYQTRLVIEPSAAQILDDCAVIFSHIERELFADICRGKSAPALKSEYLKEYQITARHFNALRVQIEGKISSIKEKQSQNIIETGYKIQSVNKTVQKLEKTSPHSNKRHQKKRLLFNLQQKLLQLMSDQETGKVRLCFGSKRLFRAQFDLAANGYKNRQEWLEDWRKARDNSFFLMGSKDESSGNQLCTATVASDGSLTLRIRLPDCFSATHGKYLILAGVSFQYGHQEIVNTLKSCEERKQRRKLKDPSYAAFGLPLSYRFKRDAKGWRVFASLPMPSSPSKTSVKQGVIGIDINANHLACTETDRFGNPLITKTIKLNTYGKNRNQTNALIGDVCATIVEDAKVKGKTLVIENLDFQKKKAQLKEQSFSTHSRMLSSLAYNKIKDNLKSRAWKNGVEIAVVNPAYTSLIGQIKFSKRYGLSIHQAAALTIGRRCLKASERVPRQMEFIPDGKGGHVALSVPVRKRDKHVWASWRIIERRLKTVLAAHFRAMRNRSSSSKPAPEIYNIPNLTGEIPVRELVNTTARLACLDLSIFV